MIAFVIVVLVIQALAVVANLIAIVALSAAHKSISANVFGILFNIAMVVWAVTLLAH